MIVGLLEITLSWYQKSLSPPSSYETIKKEKKIWETQKRDLTRKKNGKYYIHYYTIASEENSYVSNLKFSADLAGIELKVNHCEALELLLNIHINNNNNNNNNSLTDSRSWKGLRWIHSKN